MGRLSIREAAAERPRDPALIAGDEVLTYQALARRANAPPERPVVATATPQTVVALLAALEAGVPFVPMHPAWRARERSAFGALLQTHPIPSEAALVVPTSGSSGRPKAVLLSEAALVASAQASAANLLWHDDDRWLLALPLAHVGGLSVVLRCLLARRPVVLLPRFEPEPFMKAVRRHRVTLTSLVPTMLRRLLRADWRPPPHLRAVLLGGAGASPSLLRDAADRGIPVLTTYGLTEMASQVTCQPLGSVPGPEQGAGRPLEGVRLRLGAGGRIEVDGPMRMQGYLGEPPHAGFLRTGDLGRLDAAGRLHVLGRADAVIVSGGENVHPEEVESVLLEHPAVRAACVVGLPDPEWGQRVVAVVEADGRPDLAGLARERLAGPKRPKAYHFLPSLPRTPSGKVARRAVEALLQGTAERPRGA